MNMPYKLIVQTPDGNEESYELEKLQNVEDFIPDEYIVLQLDIECPDHIKQLDKEKLNNMDIYKVGDFKKPKNMSYVKIPFNSTNGKTNFEPYENVIMKRNKKD